MSTAYVNPYASLVPICTLPAAEAELTDAEILERFGPLMEDAHSAFRQDPSYIVQMVEASANLRQKRLARRTA